MRVGTGHAGEGRQLQAAKLDREPVKARTSTYWETALTMDVFISVKQLVFIAQRSATRIMRRRLRPSSLGVRLFGCGGKKMQYAALHLRTKSESGKFACQAHGSLRRA